KSSPAGSGAFHQVDVGETEGVAGDGDRQAPDPAGELFDGRCAHRSDLFPRNRIRFDVSGGPCVRGDAGRVLRGRMMYPEMGLKSFRFGKNRTPSTWDSEVT